MLTQIISRECGTHTYGSLETSKIKYHKVLLGTGFKSLYSQAVKFFTFLMISIQIIILSSS